MIGAAIRASIALVATWMVLTMLPVSAAAKTAAPVGDAVASASVLSIPIGKGLPVIVRTALLFNHIESFDGNLNTFEATTDLRLTWADARLRYPVEEGLHGYKEYRASAAEAEIAKIWIPRIRRVNQVGEPSFSERRLRVFPDGKVEIIARTTAVYKTPVDMSRFPFDHQSLLISVVVQEDTVETVDLDFSSDDVGFSRIAKGVGIDGWTPGIVTLKRELIKGWNGDRYARVEIGLDIGRVAGSTIATVFIPLFASLLIPFLATWMNKAEGAEFEVEAFELANVVVGGLFAVIALGFTISSSFPAIMVGDNTVTRLLGLNYVALAVGTIISVAFYRYRLLARWFGPYVQEQAFRFLSWAFPFLFIATGLAFLMASS